jgi:hypothetical protein
MHGIGVELGNHVGRQGVIGVMSLPSSRQVLGEGGANPFQRTYPDEHPQEVRAMRWMVMMMPKLEITYVGRIYTTAGETEAQIDAHLDRAMDELLKLDVEDPIMSGSHATGEIELTLTVTGHTDGEALELAAANLCSAFHAAGIETAGWPSDMPAQLRFEVIKRELVAAG